MNETDNAIQTFSITTSTPKETQQLGRMIAGHCSKGDCIALRGNLGAGKTEFARGFIHELVSDETQVTSPTFTLVQTYSAPGRPDIWHFDLYRLEDGADLFETGLEEALEHGITLIEWPDMAQSLLPEHMLKVQIDYGSAEGKREIQIKQESNYWTGCFAEIGKKYPHKVAHV